MRYYFAPMEGLTDSVYRRLHNKYFPGVDRYYMPFFSPTVHRQLTQRESRELPEADSVGFAAVPQVLTKVPEDFLWAAEVIRNRGYDEVNLNLGCPSGTVTAKGKGAGMLTDPEALDRFLDDVFSKCPIAISVKTRLGMHTPEEFPALLDIFNRYPIRELTVPEFEVSSAGLYANEGDPITENAVRVLTEAGIEPLPPRDSRVHRAHLLTDADAECCDRLVGMTPEHALTMMMRFPHLAGRIRTMPTPIPDPFGMDEAVYRASLAAITAGVRELLFGEKPTSGTAQ